MWRCHGQHQPLISGLLLPRAVRGGSVGTMGHARPSLNRKLRCPGLRLILARLFRIMTNITGTERAIMGGINSGRRRSIHRGAIEQFPALDLRILRRAGLLRGGECTYTTLHWRNQALEALSVRIFIDLSDDDDASMRIVGSGHNGAIAQRVAIECVPCPYGGSRTYFLCPIKGSRCEQVFLVDAMFASRQAHTLNYASQSDDELSRARRKVRKLDRQVEGDARYRRPRGQNRWSKLKRLKSAKIDARMLYSERLRTLMRDV